MLGHAQGLLACLTCLHAATTISCQLALTTMPMQAAAVLCIIVTFFVGFYHQDPAQRNLQLLNVVRHQNTSIAKTLAQLLEPAPAVADVAEDVSDPDFVAESEDEDDDDDASVGDEEGRGGGLPWAQVLGLIVLIVLACMHRPLPGGG